MREFQRFPQRKRTLLERVKGTIKGALIMSIVALPIIIPVSVVLVFIWIAIHFIHKFW